MNKTHPPEQCGNGIVHSMIDAEIGFAVPIIDALGIRANDFKRSVCRTTIDDKIFDVRMILRQNAVYRFLNILACVQDTVTTETKWSRGVRLST